MDNKIETSAEAYESSVQPRIHEVHADPEAPCATKAPLPQALKQELKGKSPARWAYERLVLYIRNFEETLDGDHEVAMGFTGGNAGILKIEGLGYFDPDILTFYGMDQNGARTQMVQRVSQLNVMLRALPKPKESTPARRIGFRLAEDLDGT